MSSSSSSTSSTSTSSSNNNINTSNHTTMYNASTSIANTTTSATTLNHPQHQQQLSINSIQSLIEPVTPPPLGQMNNKKNHQKAQSLDLSGFNQFINNTNVNTNSFNNINNQSNSLNSINGLPLINEFDPINFNNNTSISSISLNNLSQINNNMNMNNNNKNKNKNKKKNNNHTKFSSGNSSSNTHNNNKSRNNNNNNNISIPSSSASSSTISTFNSTTNDSNNNSFMNEIANTPLEELDYIKLATDQFGCRFLQKKLESNSITESNLVRDLMYDQIKPFLLNLILDPFGNYLIQKLCEFLTINQKTSLINEIYPHVFKISINQYGTRSLQKIIDTVDNETQIDLIIKGFSPMYTSIEQVVTLINDLNGNHVIQKCIFKFPSNKFDFIINAIIEKNNIITISTHKHGCCVLQKLLSVCTLQQIFKISIKIIQFLPGLINDQFGNYIIQFLLDINELDFYSLNEIFNKLSNELCQLSCLKFSSNVIEKFIKKIFNIINSSIKGEILPNINDDVVNNTMNILLNIVDIFTINLNILIRDNYGNYALQTLLDIKNYNLMLEYTNDSKNGINKYSSFRHDFTQKISNLILLTKELLPSIKTTSYAKKIKLKVKAYSELTGVASFPNNNVNNIINTDQSIMKTPLQSSSSFDTKNNNNNNNSAYKQHQRHFSLPANAYHRRNSSIASSSSFVSNTSTKQMNSIGNHGQLQGQHSLHNPSMNVFNSQNSSPLNFSEQHFNNNNSNITSSNTMMSAFIPQHQSSSSLSYVNNLSLPLAHLSLNDNSIVPQQHQPNYSPQPPQSMFFLNDNNVPLIGNNINNNNNNSNINTNSNNSSLYHSSTLHEDITTPNPSSSNYSKFAFTSPNPMMSTSGNDLSFLSANTTPQQQRIVSSQYPLQNQTYPNNNDMLLTTTNNINNSLMFLGDDEFKNFNLR